MRLTNRTCSNCNYWAEPPVAVIDGVVTASCVMELLLKSIVTTKITKGSHSCSGWKRIKWKTVYNPISDEMIKNKDYT
jgi:hypothetical protein